MIVLAILAGTFGTLIGSFLNVVVYRVPAGRSLISPPSSCGSCGHEIRRRDNIPVLSWVLLRGRCRDCKTSISVRYPLVEAGTAALFVLVAIRFGVPAGSGAEIAAQVLTLLAFAYLASISIALGLIDLDTRRLPDAIVVPAYLVGALLLSGSSLLAGDPAALLRGAIGMVALFAFYFLLAFATGGMGYGDVKLAGVLGLFLAWMGWDVLVVGALGAFVFGGLFGIALLAARRAGRRTAVPFGPWMLAGAWLGILAGEPVASTYLDLVGIH